MDNNKIVEILNDIRADLLTKSTSVELQNLVTILEEKELRIASLEKTVIKLTDRLTELETKSGHFNSVVADITSKNSILESSNRLLDRKCDDQEQVSRKVNIRFVGIDLKENETPDSLLAVIKAECNRLDLGLSDGDFDHCHRNGKVDSTGEKPKQTVLLKMRSWHGRNVIYENRKRMKNIKVFHDLTTRRRKLLAEANEMISNGADNVVAFTLADKNCKLKLKSTNGRYFHFNSIEEFSCIVIKLQNEIVGAHFAQDERDELFY